MGRAGVVDLHLVTGLDVLQAFDDHPLAAGQAAADDPAVALGAAQYTWRSLTRACWSTTSTLAHRRCHAGWRVAAR
jgi:hypothetical protein